MSAPYLGSCYCGAIEVSLADELDGGVLCHCITCQKLHTQNSYNVQSTLSKLSFPKGTPAVRGPNCSNGIGSRYGYASRS
ncbi:hypothetical protein RQP46_009607 [Phenoliferia psychrophenolica]